MTIFVIEHLEERVYPWVLLEYKHISNIVGKKNLLITNVKRDAKKLEKVGWASKQSVSAMKLKNACVLDPEARKELHPGDAKNFDAFIFGGILGDYPPRKRTAKELTSRVVAAKRNLGGEQMSTDTAVHVVKRIIKGQKISEMDFVDGITIPMNAGEEIELPYRYLVVRGKPVLPRGLIAYLKKGKGF